MSDSTPSPHKCCSHCDEEKGHYPHTKGCPPSPPHHHKEPEEEVCMKCYRSLETEAKARDSFEDFIRADERQKIKAKMKNYFSGLVFITDLRMTKKAHLALFDKDEK